MSSDESTSAYRFTDASLLRPWLQRVWFARLFPLLPRWLAANLVTVMSTGLLGGVLLATRMVDRIGAGGLALVQLIAIQLYVAGDHLDGMQAKATKTTSPLGDFLDHHCDLWAGAVLCYGFVQLGGGALAGQGTWMAVLLSLGFAITFVERAQHRRLHFTSWGTLEAISITTLFYVSWMVPPVRAWWQATGAFGAPRWQAVSLIGVTMCSGVIVVIARRLGRIPASLSVHVASVVAFAAWVLRAESLDPMVAWVLVTLFGAEYVARVMQAHASPRPLPWPSWWFVGLAVAGWVAAPRADLPVAAWWGIGAVLTVRYLITLARIIAGWRQHWVWVNSSSEATT